MILNCTAPVVGSIRRRIVRNIAVEEDHSSSSYLDSFGVCGIQSVRHDLTIVGVMVFSRT